MTKLARFLNFAGKVGGGFLGDMSGFCQDMSGFVFVSLLLDADYQLRAFIVRICQGYVRIRGVGA